jgi:hypothetical protein
MLRRVAMRRRWRGTRCGVPSSTQRIYVSSLRPQAPRSVLLLRAALLRLLPQQQQTQTAM